MPKVYADPSEDQTPDSGQPQEPEVAADATAPPREAQPAPRRKAPRPAPEEQQGGFVAGAICLVMMLAGLVGVLAYFAFRGEAAVSNVQQGTSSNFDELVYNSGKNVFTKFHAPWCGNCKRMKPAWEQLAAEYKNHSSVLIMDVDCTAKQGKPICTQFGVKGYPTMRYFTSETGKNGSQYQSGRDFESLQKFVVEKLLPCNLETLENCGEHQQAVIGQWKGKAPEDVEQHRTTLQTEKERLEAEFQAKEKEFHEYKKRHEDESKKLNEALHVMSMLARRAEL